MAIQNAESRLEKFRVFQGLSADDILTIAPYVEEDQIRAGKGLFHQGDAPDFFYLVESGLIDEVGQDRAGKVVLRRSAEEGDFVGRWALMNDERRRATATVTKSAKLLRIGAADFKSLVEVFPKFKENLERSDVVSRLLAIPLFHRFSEDQLRHIADLVVVMEYSSDQSDRTIFRQGDKPDEGFYIVDTGQVLEEGRYVTAGNFFGHEDVLKNRLRRRTATAETEVRLFRLEADDFKWLDELGPGLYKTVSDFDIEKYLKMVPIFSACDAEDFRRLAGYVGLARYRPGDVLFYQGEFNPTLYFLYKGAVVTLHYDEQTGETSQRYLRASRKEGKVVGQSALFLEEPRDVTAKATTDTLLLYLCRSDLERLLTERPEIEERLILKKTVVERQRLKRFPWMEPDEHTLFQQRRHWFVVVARMAVPILLLLGILILSLLNMPTELQGVLRCIRPFVLFLSIAWVVWRFVDWTNDYYVVTNQRAVHEEKVLMMRETRDEAPLSKIQNINIDRHLVGNVLGFGKLTIDTAARAGASRVIFDYLGDPAKAQSLVFEQMSRVRASEKLKVQRAIREKLGDRLDTGLKPTVPQPVIPPSAEVAAPQPEGPDLLKSIYQATLGQWLWIEQRERDRVTWRKHWLRLLRRIWLPSLIVSLWILTLVLYWRSTDLPSWEFIGIWILCLLPLLFWWWWNWEDWSNDRYIVTNDRIIDIEAWPLGVRSKRTETMFDRIQNVSFEIPHPIATAFNYGTVILYTAGAEGRLDFEYVRDPKGVQIEIFRRLAAYEDKQSRRQREERWADLPDWFAEYDQVRRP